MPARCRIDSPTATSSPPIQLASTGLPAVVLWAFNLSAVGAGVAEQVDGVAVTPGQREDAVERLDALGRQVGQLAAASDQGIGGEHAGAARVGQDRQAVALQLRLGVE